MERLPTVLEKTFVKHTSDMELIARVYKEFEVNGKNIENKKIQLQMGSKFKVYF